MRPLRFADARHQLHNYTSRFVAATRPYHNPESLIVRF
jgi:hypothetical protein